MQNTIYLRRKLSLIVADKDNKGSRKHLATILFNIESLGFRFCKSIVSKLEKYDVQELDIFYKNVVKNLKNMIGANVKYNPMYPNFPEQIMEADKIELYFNALMHYYTLTLPEYDKQDKPDLVNKKYKLIKLGNKEEFNNIFKNLINAKVAVSIIDKQDIKWFIKQNKTNILDYLPERIDNKENLSFIISVLKEENILSDQVLSKYFKTATDVLRYITALSDGDVSLKDNTKFINFKRPDRRTFLRILENCNNITEDMLRYSNRWKRIGEILHPGEFKDRYPKTFKAFDIIRNNKPFETFNSKVVKSIKNDKVTDLLEIISTRPGDFARKLDWIIRSFKSHKAIVNSFNKIADKVSNTVLLQVKEHFMYRNLNNYRSFMPKGIISKIQLIDNNLPYIDEQTCLDIINICETSLINKFSNLNKLGNVYIDTELNNYPVPFALRSASKSLRTVTRGSRIKLDVGNIIRLFTYWKNTSDRVDIDLSAVMYDKNWKYMTHVGYTNLRENFSCHSGDITDAPKGASEFIDININKAIKYGAKYIVSSIKSYTEQDFVDVPICFAGCMMRKDLKSGEIYEPSTVTDKFDITSKSKSCIPLIFDLEEREIIWTDLPISINKCFCNNINNNKDTISLMGKALTDISKPNLYDLFTLHGIARGKIVQDKSKADIIFNKNNAFEIEDIIANYL